MNEQFERNNLEVPKIRNGSKIEFGNCSILADHHFNWFQKKMIKWCFGFNVTDYSEKQKGETNV